MGKVDATVETGLAETYGVEEYPLLLIFHGGMCAKWASLLIATTSTRTRLLAPNRSEEHKPMSPRRREREVSTGHHQHET